MRSRLVSFSLPKIAIKEKQKRSWRDNCPIPCADPFLRIFFLQRFLLTARPNHTNLLMISTHRNWPKTAGPKNQLVAHSLATAEPGPLSILIGKRDQTPREDAQIQFNHKSGRAKKKNPVDRSGLTELVKRLSEKEGDWLAFRRDLDKLKSRKIKKKAEKKSRARQPFFLFVVWSCYLLDFSLFVLKEVKGRKKQKGTQRDPSAGASRITSSMCTSQNNIKSTILLYIYI